MKLNEPILITGCARSGTSMTAGIINLCGAWGGNMSGPNKNNKKGMFENAQIRNMVIKPFLISIGADPMGQYPLPDPKMIAEAPNLKERANDIHKRIKFIIFEQGYDASVEWFYKGAKICLIWPLFAEAFLKARWIIVRRDTEDIVNSCMRTNFMRAFKGEKGWFWWVDEHKERFLEMADAGLDIQYVWPQRIVNGDFSEIKAVVERLGLKWDQEKVKDLISPALWKGGK